MVLGGEVSQISVSDRQRFGFGDGGFLRFGLHLFGSRVQGFWVLDGEGLNPPVSLAEPENWDRTFVHLTLTGREIR